MFAKWDSTYSVGVVEIDQQHQKLFAMIGELYDAMKAGKGKDVTGKILDGLAEYTVTHFATEEKYFNEFHYEETVRHKQAHKAFVEKVKQFQEQFKNGHATVTLELLNFLTTWLTEHIKVTDKRYEACFHEHGLK